MQVYSQYTVQLQQTTARILWEGLAWAENKDNSTNVAYAYGDNNPPRPQCNYEAWGGDFMYKVGNL